jgi:glycosyltransferase involved in cell wall biosynthesis
VTARPTLTIVIPAYNEAARLPETLARLDAYFAGRDPRSSWWTTGARDGTAEAGPARRAGAHAPDGHRVPENRGKGAAVRAGVAASTGEQVIYMDADLATDISRARRLL